MLPTTVMAILFKDFLEGLFHSVKTVAGLLIFTAVILWLASKKEKKGKGFTSITIIDALIVGFGQGIALAPGVSRSGITIAFGIFCGLEGYAATRYSFLLSIFTILGATLYKVIELFVGRGESIGLEWGAVITGVFVALISGYLAIDLLFRVVKKGKLSYFAYYCVFLAFLVFIFF